MIHDDVPASLLCRAQLLTIPLQRGPFTQSETGPLKAADGRMKRGFVATGWIRPLRFALAEQVRHPWRTLLVSQGMIWAVALTLVPAAVIDGTRQEATLRAHELGTNLIQVAQDRSLGSSQAIQQQDLEPLRAILPDEAVVSGLRVQRAGMVREGLPRGEVWLLGCDAHVVGARGKELMAGRLPAERPRSVEEVAAAEDVAAVEATIEATLAEILFGGTEAAIGQTFGLRIQGDSDTQLEVVGVIEDESSGGPDPLGRNKERVTYALAKRLLRALGIAPSAAPWREQGVGIYLPRSVLPGEQIDWLFVRVPPLAVGTESQRIEGFLADRGRTPLIYTNPLWPVLTSPELNGYMTIHTVFFGLFLGMGLAVLTNLLLLSGWQRRYEIALRRAEGASRGAIFGQFLWEGVSVALIGWFLGVIVALALAHVRAALDPFTIMTVGMPWFEIGRSGLILSGGAIVASAYPAWRASSYHPMSLFRRT